MSVSEARAAQRRPHRGVGSRRRAAVLAPLVAVALGLGLAGGVSGVTLAAAQEEMRSLEDALGDSLDVRRNEDPDGEAPDDEVPPAGEEAGDDAGDGTGDGARAGDGSDGVRELVPPDAEADDTAPGAGNGEAPTPDGGDPLDLGDRDGAVEGEGRGAGELVGGVPGRVLVIAVAVLALVGSATTLTVVSRRYLVDPPT